MADAKMEQTCARAMAVVAEPASVEATAEPGVTAELEPDQACTTGKAAPAESASVEATAEPKTGAAAELEPDEASAEAKTDEQILVFVLCKFRVSSLCSFPKLCIPPPDDPDVQPENIE